MAAETNLIELQPQAPSDTGAKYERLAFNFCKAATIILLTGRFALPVASGAATVFYLLAHHHGKRDTRCILKRPLIIAAFWGTICLLSLFLIFVPGAHRLVGTYLFSHLPFLPH
jgi:hypothetical protein